MIGGQHCEIARHNLNQPSKLGLNSSANFGRQAFSLSITGKPPGNLDYSVHFLLLMGRHQWSGKSTSKVKEQVWTCLNRFVDQIFDWNQSIKALRINGVLSGFRHSQLLASLGCVSHCLFLATLVPGGCTLTRMWHPALLVFQNEWRRHIQSVANASRKLSSEARGSFRWKATSSADSCEANLFRHLFSDHRMQGLPLLGFISWCCSAAYVNFVSYLVTCFKQLHKLTLFFTELQISQSLNSIIIVCLSISVQ